MLFPENWHRLKIASTHFCNMQCDWPKCESTDANYNNDRGSWLCDIHMDFVRMLKEWILLGTGIDGL